MKLKASVINAFHKYQVDAWAEMDDGLKAYIKKQNSEDLHRMRVSYKKLMALYNFLHSVNHHNYDKDLKPLRKVFKLSGKLRDRTNANIFCDKFGIKHSVFGKEEPNEKETLERLENKYESKKKKFKKLEEQLKGELNKQTLIHFSGYFQKVYKNVHHTLHAKNVRTNLHSCRKHIKELVYLAKIQKSSTLLSKQKLDILNELQDMIGDWHDINKFRRKLQALKNPPAKKLLEKVIEKEQLVADEILNISQFLK